MQQEQRLERKRELARNWAAKWRAANLELAREKDRIKNQERRKGAAGEKLRAWGRARYAAKADEMRAKKKEWYHKNINHVRDKALAYHRKQYAGGRIAYRMQRAFFAAKSRAKKRGIKFDLKLSDLGLPTHCAVTGIKFEMTGSFRDGNIFVPSLDRIDPALGYTTGNVRVVCHGYNLAKHTGTDSDVLKLARALVKAFPE